MKSKRFLVLSAAILLLNAAGLLWIRHELTRLPKPRLRVLSALPGQDASAADRLAFVFDQPLAAADALGRPAEHSPLVLEPAAAGKWTWTAADRLEFVLDEPLPPGRVYLARFADGAEARIGRSIVGERQFRFQTAPLALRACNLLTADHEAVTFELVFNQDVDGQELLRHLNIRSQSHGEGEPPVLDSPPAVDLQPVLLTTKPAAKHVLRCPRSQAEQLRVTLAGELAGFGGQLPLGRPVVRYISVPRAFALLRAEPHTPGLDKDVTVHLAFSNEIDRAQDLPAVRVEPPVEGVRPQFTYNGLYLRGPFECGKRYKATVPATLMSDSGKTLGREQSVNFEIPDRQTAVRFEMPNGILSPEGHLQTELAVVNTSKLAVSAVRLHANNLAGYLKGLDIDEVGREVLKKDIPLDLPRNQIKTLALDLRSLLGKSAGTTPRGVYCVWANAGRYRYQAARNTVCITDLALTVKRGRDGLLVWATSLRQGKAQPGVKVTALSSNNQTLAGGTTGPDGLVELALPPNHPDGPAWLVTAQLGEDLSFLRLDENRWMLDGVDTSGRAYPKEYDLFLYSERGIYRPGDTVRLTGLVRDARGQVPPDFPLSVRVFRPDGRQVAEVAVPAEKRPGQGIFHAEYATVEEAPTGWYRFAATLPGSGEVLGETQAMVEAYVPVRMEVKAAPSAALVTTGQSAHFDVSARYLWGQAAADLPVVARTRLEAARYSSQRFARFVFHDGLDQRRHTLNEQTLHLDQDGRCTVPLALDEKDDDESEDQSPPEASRGAVEGPPEAPRAPSPFAGRMWRVVFSAGVTEAGGRTVSANAELTADLVGRHVGLRLASPLARAGQPLAVQCVLVDAADQVLPLDKLVMSVDRIEHDSALRQVDGRMVWQSVERLISEVKPRPLVAAAVEGGHGAGRFDVTCRSAGRYRLTVRDTAGPARGQIDFYVRDSGDDEASLAMDEPERLEMVLDRAKYVPGEKARVLVRSPIPGTMLLTLESDRVLERRVVEIHKQTAEVELTVPASLRGGAFVSASVVRAVDPAAKQWLPHRAMGLARVVCDHSGNELELTVKAPAEARPAQSIDVTVDTHLPAHDRRPTMIHLWAVDEGILLTTSFACPDPLRHFLAPRRASVETHDAFFDLLPDYHRPVSMARIGAGDEGEEEPMTKDGGARASMRRSTVPLRQRAADVVWLGAAPTDLNGRLTTRVTLPDRTGRIRLMATAADGDLYGQARCDVTVTAPLLVEATWPRFAAPGDRFALPIKLFNSTTRDLAVRVKLDLHGPVAVDGGDDLSAIPVPAKGSALRMVLLRADAPGQVEAAVTAGTLDAAGAPGLQAHCDALMTVRPVTTPHAVTRIWTAKAGDELTIEPDKSFVPGTTVARVAVSGRPNVQLRSALERLLEYPYGCLEQTTSRLAAILYAPDLMALEGGEDARTAHAREMVNSGILRLWSMQTASGGLGYWPGDRQPSVWGTAYAAEFLIQAQRAGYRVDPRFMNELAGYLESALQRTPSTHEQYPHEADYGMASLNTRAMILHLLALHGRAQHGWMARLGERLDELDMGGRAHLAGAYLAVGRKDRAMAVLPRQTIEMLAATTTSGELTSQTRQEALLLGVMLDIDKDHPWAGLLADRLNKTRSNGHWGTTLSNASALIALARYQLATAGQATSFRGTLTADGSAPVAFDHTKPVACTFKSLAGPLRLTSQGEGPIYVSMTTEGQAAAGVVKPFQRNLVLQRRWLDRKGKPLVDATSSSRPDAARTSRLRVGDLVQVEITVGVTGLNRSVGNVAIVDALPGGLEVENPRLATSSAVGEAEGEGTPAGVAVGRADRTEFLDDRVVLFASVHPGKQVFRYSLRATTAGQFAIPPVQGSCMYDPAVAALGEGSQLVIEH